MCLVLSLKLFLHLLLLLLWILSLCLQPCLLIPLHLSLADQSVKHPLLGCHCHSQLSDALAVLQLVIVSLFVGVHLGSGCSCWFTQS